MTEDRRWTIGWAQEPPHEATVKSGDAVPERIDVVPLETREELEDALLGYFGGGYPRGSCASRQEAEGTLWAAIERARERELEELRKSAEA